MTDLDDLPPGLSYPEAEALTATLQPLLVVDVTSLRAFEFALCAARGPTVAIEGYADVRV